ncbi:MAG: glycosyltransferase [Oscillospiraceae bacterium]|nr:glycosyltransferase [Oscillospiraceae bacterium]
MVLENNRYISLCCKGLKLLQQRGFRATWRKVCRKLHLRVGQAPKRLFTRSELEQQVGKRFPINIKFSIIVPLYNTPRRFLKEMIQSILCQTYDNWELCMADGSDEEHFWVGEICRDYAAKDSRIHYRRLPSNLGISGNSNACLKMSSGDYLVLVDHDDWLHPAALHEIMEAICTYKADFIYTDENTFHRRPQDAYLPHYKPDFSPDSLRSNNYICHLTAFSRGLLEQINEGFRSSFDGSQDYDLILRLTEKAKQIIHIPEILYYWRSHKNSTASDTMAKPYAIAAAKGALAEHLERVGLSGKILDSVVPSTYRIKYKIIGTPLVSILISNKDHTIDLQKCINSITEKTTYSSWEIIIIDNNSVEEEIFEYYEKLEKDARIKIVYWPGKFNYSAINNFGVEHAKGEYLILLNNDTEVITSTWIEEMLMFVQRSDVGAAGCMLYYPDETVQHGGVILGSGGVAGHFHKHFQRNDYGYMSRMTFAQNLSATTAACMMIRRDVWDKAGGLDEKFAIAFNDIDLCMRIRKLDYLIVWTPYAELYHDESKSRGKEDTIEKQRRFISEVKLFQSRWEKELAHGDPYYNPNLPSNCENLVL